MLVVAGSCLAVAECPVA